VELTPWCTSWHSTDCAAMAATYQDGTRIAFIADPQEPGRIVTDVVGKVECETKTRQWMQRIRGTAGARFKPLGEVCGQSIPGALARVKTHTFHSLWCVSNARAGAEAPARGRELRLSPANLRGAGQGGGNKRSPTPRSVHGTLDESRVISNLSLAHTQGRTKTFLLY
jgi:hypothetical protein